LVVGGVGTFSKIIRGGGGGSTEFQSQGLGHGGTQVGQQTGIGFRRPNCQSASGCCFQVEPHTQNKPKHSRSKVIFYFISSIMVPVYLNKSRLNLLFSVKMDCTGIQKHVLY